MLAHRRFADAPTMLIEPTFLLFIAVVASGYAVQTATGFGSMLVCVTLGAHLVGIDEVVRLVVPISFLQTGYIILRYHRAIEWRLLATRVLPLMGVGMGVAFVLTAVVGGPWLGLAFGIMVLVLSARELHTIHVARVQRNASGFASIAALFGAGVVHGIYATGGPMLVYALGREGLSKKVFRSTLAMIWLLLNAILFARSAIAGAYSRELVLDVLMFIPAVPVGIALGEWVHHRVNEQSFKTAVLTLLLAAAISLIVRYSSALL